MSGQIISDVASHRESLSPELQEDFDIIFGGPHRQRILFTGIPYIDHNNNKKTIVSAVYNVVHDALPTLLPPSPRPAYELRDVPGKGKGMIATRDIDPGELVIVERPILISPRLMMNENLNPSSSFRAYAERKMSQEDRVKFYDLANALRDTTVLNWDSEFNGIIHTNGFGVDWQEGKEKYTGIFIELSRFNHSCGPNLRRFWNPNLFTLTAQAVRPIRAGQELTVPYIDLFLPCAERRSILRNNYRFHCQCPYCVKSSPTSDENRQILLPQGTYENILEKYNNLINPANKIPRPLGRLEAMLLANDLNNMLAIIVDEGIEEYAAPVLYMFLTKVSGILGDQKEFRRWGIKMILFSADCVDFEAEKGLEQWIGWMKAPETFPEWGRYR